MLSIHRAPWIALMLLVCVGCGPRLTDRLLLDYASSDYDKALYDQPAKILGRLGGVDVVVEYKCSDVCPNYTVRVIRFDLPPDTTCDEAGGRYVTFELPPFSHQPRDGYCVPSVLVNNWEQYVK